MKFSEENIKILSKKMKKSGLTEISLEVQGVTLVLKNEPVLVKENFIQQIDPVRINEENKKEATNLIVKDTLKIEESIQSPMIGTFYGRNSPESSTFVVIGQEVKEGDTLCILEAMKMMNEVKATKNCKILKVLIQDGELVKKGEPLFIIS